MAIIEHILRIKGTGDAAAGLKDVAAAAENAGRKLSANMAEGIDKAGAAAGKLGQGLGVISPTLGGFAMAIADGADGLLALATPAGAAVGALVLVAGAATGAVAATAGLIGGLGALALAADDALGTLEGFKLIGSDIYPDVPPATLAGIREANAALEAMSSIAALLTVEIGGNVAPAFATAGKAAVGLALEVLDAIRALTEGQSILKAVVVGIGSALVEPLVMVLRPLAVLQDAYTALADLAGVQVPDALRNNVARLEMMRVEMVGAAVDSAALATSTGRLGEMIDGLTARGGAFVEQQIRATDALEDAAGAADRQREALERLKKAQEDASAALAYDLQLGERAVKVAEAQRAANEAAASTIGQSFGIGEAIGGAAGATQSGFQTRQLVGTANQVAGIAGSLQGGAGGLAGAAGQIGGAAGMAAAGPIVAAIMQVMQLVTSLVPEEGAMGLQDQIHSFFMEFFNDLGQLPAVLAKGMQESIRDGIPALFEAIPALVEGLIAAIPQLLMATIEQFPLMIGGLVQMLIVGIPKAILEGIGQLFSKDLWDGLAKSFTDALREIFTPLFGNKDTGERGFFQSGGYLDQVFVGGRERARGERSILGSRASGDDYIPQTGLYLMHRGETVSGNGRLPPGTTGGSGGVTVVVQGSVLGTVEDIARAMREAGRRGVSFG